MAENSKIEWTTHTFNPWRGCSKVSEGCEHCYACDFSKLNPGTLGKWGPQGTRVVASESTWRLPLKWDRESKRGLQAWALHFELCRQSGIDDPAAEWKWQAGDEPIPERHRVFCASFADVFEDWDGPMEDSKGRYGLKQGGAIDWVEPKLYPESKLGFPANSLTMHDVRLRLFALIDATPNLDWLLLTKRPENIAKMMPPYSFHACETGDCPHETTRDCNSLAERQYRENLWLGVSVENQKAADERIPLLLQTPAAVRFLSCEPLLGAVDLREHLNGDSTGHETGGSQGWQPGELIDWVIVGGESGHGARPCDTSWVRSIVRQCRNAGVACFVKQVGGKPVTTLGGQSDAANGCKTFPMRLHDKKGGDWGEWPEDLRVREFPKF